MGVEVLSAIADRSALGVELLGRLAAEESLAEGLERCGAERGEAAQGAAIAVVAVSAGWTEAGPAEPIDAWIRHWTADDEIRALIDFHPADGQEWVRQEPFESLVNWRLALAVAALGRSPADAEAAASDVRRWLELGAQLRALALAAGYQVTGMRSAAVAAQPGAEPSGGPSAGPVGRPDPAGSVRRGGRRPGRA